MSRPTSAISLRRDQIPQTFQITDSTIEYRSTHAYPQRIFHKCDLDVSNALLQRFAVSQIEPHNNDIVEAIKDIFSPLFGSELAHPGNDPSAHHSPPLEQHVWPHVHTWTSSESNCSPKASKRGSTMIPPPDFNNATGVLGDGGTRDALVGENGESSPDFVSPFAAHYNIELWNTAVAGTDADDENTSSEDDEDSSDEGRSSTSVSAEAARSSSESDNTYYHRNNLQGGDIPPIDPKPVKEALKSYSTMCRIALRRMEDQQHVVHWGGGLANTCSLDLSDLENAKYLLARTLIRGPQDVRVMIGLAREAYEEAVKAQARRKDPNYRSDSEGGKRGRMSSVSDLSDPSTSPFNPHTLNPIPKEDRHATKLSNSVAEILLMYIRAVRIGYYRFTKKCEYDRMQDNTHPPPPTSFSLQLETMTWGEVAAIVESEDLSFLGLDLTEIGHEPLLMTRPVQVDEDSDDDEDDDSPKCEPLSDSEDEPVAMVHRATEYPFLRDVIVTIVQAGRIAHRVSPTDFNMMAYSDPASRPPSVMSQIDWSDHLGNAEIRSRLGSIFDQDSAVSGNGSGGSASAVSIASVASYPASAYYSCHTSHSSDHSASSSLGRARNIPRRAGPLLATSHSHQNLADHISQPPSPIRSTYSPSQAHSFNRLHSLRDGDGGLPGVGSPSQRSSSSGPSMDPHARAIKDREAMVFLLDKAYTYLHLGGVATAWSSDDGW